MATKATKKVEVQSDRIAASELKPRDIDAKYWGSEPIFNTQPTPETRCSTLCAAFNWYGRFYDATDARKFIIDCIHSLDSKANVKSLSTINPNKVNRTYGWLARMYLRGLELTEDEKIRFNTEVARLYAVKSEPVPESLTAAKKKAAAANRPNVQEIMRERTREVGGEIEGWFDEFTAAGPKAANIDIPVVGLMSELNIMPQHVSMLTDAWKTKQIEFLTVLAEEDEQLSEAYAHYTKPQLKAIVKYCDSVIANLNSYITVKKASKSPRKRKPISPEKQVAKVKYMKTDDELKLNSIHPAKILGSTEVWAYDTAKRKLHYYIADSHIGTLGIKGTTIIGFDETNSGMKTLRKPAEVLKKLMAGGKPASRKVFAEVNAVQAIPSGRTNENLIILKVY